MSTDTGFDPRSFQARLERLEVLLNEAERLSDPAMQSRLREIVQTILELHGVGLERLLEHVAGHPEAGQALLDRCVRDELVAGLLLLHGLHPLDLEARVQQALEAVRPYLHSHGGNVELLGVEEGEVRLTLQGSCHSCPSSTVTMQQTIEEAIYARAPEVTAIKVEGMEGAVLTQSSGARIALPLL